MTPAQSAYLQSLCLRTHVEFDPRLTKAGAFRRIEQLKREGDHGPASMSQMMLAKVNTP